MFILDQNTTQIIDTDSNRKFWLVQQLSDNKYCIGTDLNNNNIVKLGFYDTEIEAKNEFKLLWLDLVAGNLSRIMK